MIECIVEDKEVKVPVALLRAVNYEKVDVRVNGHKIYAYREGYWFTAGQCVSDLNDIEGSIR